MVGQDAWCSSKLKSQQSEPKKIILSENLIELRYKKDLVKTGYKYKNLKLNETFKRTHKIKKWVLQDF